MDDDDALPPDRVPPELEGLVEREPDGALRFQRVVPAPWLGLAVALLVGGAAIVPGLAMVLATLKTAELATGLMALGVNVPVAMVVGAMGWFGARTRSRDSRASLYGLDGEPWGDAVGVRLLGHARTRRARLLLVYNGGRVVELKRWWSLRHHRHAGWDHDSVRWFAARLAEIANVPLQDDLPDAEAWQSAVQARERADSPRSPPVGDPVVPERLVTHDAVEFRIEGDNGPFIVFVPAGTSYSAREAIAVSPTHVRVGGTVQPVEAVHDIVSWFGWDKRGKRKVKVGQVRAITDHGHWVLAERLDSRTAPGVVVGAADALRAELLAAKAGRRDDGGREEVPEALREVASRAVAREGER